jgi:hypothetical protein
VPPIPRFSRALEEQIAEKNARKRQEVAEREEWERKKDAELGVMDYFGSGGGGAPLKGQGGTVVSDLRWSAVALSEHLCFVPATRCAAFAEVTGLT